MRSDHPDDARLFQDAELIALARGDFLTFVELAFPILHDGKTLDYADYMSVVADALVSTRTGGSRRLIFNQPRCTMNSMLISVLYTAWLLGVDPTLRILCISYGNDLTHLLSRTVRKLMVSALYRTIFASTVLVRKAEDHIETVQGGGRYTAAVGSDISGFRADVIVIDDPMQPDESVNELAKQKLRDWYDGVVAQRLLDPPKGVIILVMHRLAPDDLIGTFLERGGWMLSSFPLIATEQVREWRDAKGRLPLRRERGDLLNPTRLSPEDAEALKTRTPPHIFDLQYQQNPRFGASGVCSVDRFVRYTLLPPLEVLIHSWTLREPSMAATGRSARNSGW